MTRKNGATTPPSSLDARCSPQICFSLKFIFVKDSINFMFSCFLDQVLHLKSIQTKKIAMKLYVKQMAG